MKTFRKSIYVSLVCLAMVFASCSKEDNNNDDGGGGNGGGSEFLTAKVDGANFEAAQSPAVIVSATISNNIFILQGGNNDGDTVRATINGYNGVGTYQTGNDISNTSSLSYITLPANTWMSTFNIGTGTLTVTSDDGTTVEGTFSFEGFNAQDSTTKNITEGNFKATIE